MSIDNFHAVTTNQNLNEVTDEECREAIEYLYEGGFVNEMTDDKRVCTKILLKKVANIFHIKLENIDDEH